jgi:hypothetical protein
MAQESENKDVFTRLAEVGEDAIHKVADIAGMSKVTDTLNSLRTRVDDLSRRVRGIDELKVRLEALERRVDELTGTERPTQAASSTTVIPDTSPDEPTEDTGLS